MNTGKHRPEKTPYLNIFHDVLLIQNLCLCQMFLQTTLVLTCGRYSKTILQTTLVLTGGRYSKTVLQTTLVLTCGKYS